MPRVILTAPFGADWFGGASEVTVEGKNLFAIARALDALAPGFGEVIDEKASVVVDDVVAGEWSAALANDAEVLIVPKLAGGWSVTRK